MEKESKIETREKEPKISYHIFYSPHWMYRDFKKLEEYFKNPDNEVDIYVPEGMGWSKNSVEVYNALSRGEFNALDLAGEYSISLGSCAFRESQMLEGSKKKVLFVDLPQDHELIESLRKSANLSVESISLFKDGEFQSAIQKMHDYALAWADTQLKREELIKQNLKEKIKEFIQDEPELKKKKKINVLMRLGQLHTSIYHVLKKEKLPVSRQFSYKPVIFPSIAEIIRTKMINKDKKISNETLARAIIEMMLHTEVLHIIGDTEKLTKIERKISSKLNLKDIKKISERMGENPEENIANSLEQFGIKIPKTEQEMDEMLKK